MLKWFSNHSDEPLALVAIILTALLPLIALVAAIAWFAVPRRRTALADVLGAVAVVGFLATLAWFFVIAPWSGGGWI